MSLRRQIVIIPIFGSREVSSLLAYDPSHSVPGLPGRRRRCFLRWCCDSDRIHRSCRS
ncbi:hypothetical protein EDB81DRAFT_792275 [Dactylonectria macrodidyma]|uniref:Uncharacterized protein n=1 Tax=Dactylonectria macrodidyma TaxID=307937 RepID=A0A9P9EXV2_9HYPO|nr:hypothetical protein EDB81DRAFT_792275 [Dactylonectria macrodidyma]